MFSGIVEELGSVLEIRDSEDGRWIKIGACLVTSDVSVGASISISGACMTAIEFRPEWFAVELTHESLRRSTLASLKVGSKVNLERAMKLSDRIGGHLVSGHVDAIGKVSRIVEEGFSKVMWFELPADLCAFFVEKGSVAVEGVSFTVVDIEPRSMQDTDKSFEFSVALIPHTMEVTTLGLLEVGSNVNVETDVVARYVARWALPYVARNLNKEGIKIPFALEQG